MDERLIVTRRTLLLSLLAVPAAAATDAPMVSIAEFTDAGKKVRVAMVPKVVKTESEWREILPPIAFAVTRLADTERPFTGATPSSPRSRPRARASTRRSNHTNGATAGLLSWSPPPRISSPPSKRCSRPERTWTRATFTGARRS